MDEVPVKEFLQFDGPTDIKIVIVSAISLIIICLFLASFLH